IMAHYVRVMPHKTFRINPSVCPPYNADFDGDEMNLHALQTEEAEAEARILMDVKNNMISPKFGGPIIGLDLDQISGIYLLTHKDVVMSKEEACQLFADAGIDIDLPDKETFTGKEIFSMLLPKNISIEFKANCCKCDEKGYHECPDDGYVVIKNGVLESGRIDAKAVGAFKGKLLVKLQRICGNDVTKKLIDDYGRLGIAYLMKRGFSIGISDLDLPRDVHKLIRKEIQKAEEESHELIRQYNEGTLKILPGMTMAESLEAQILNTLASSITNVSNIVSENIRRSDIITMFEAGAKGSIINTTQMAAVVGQETVFGKRIMGGYLHRTLPHFAPNDLSPMSHGFVSSGFKDGLTPFELFWNIMNGREGLMDKSLRTRKSGYMQRRLVYALQDLKVHSDGTVRNAHNQIIQFVAGEDMVDPTKSDWGKVEWKNYL
ncbi:MAG TPA: DNA-directed RNA polymerase subunit A', partial [Candidatus Aenigmarchaeota archaeon]|nr:DNA-directed RNA polymerase subunit A' [Candidatus Aenigmarchaeota archaeon]